MIKISLLQRIKTVSSGCFISVSKLFSKLINDFFSYCFFSSFWPESNKRMWKSFYGFNFAVMGWESNISNHPLFWTFSRAQFHQHFIKHANFLYESALRSFSLVTFWLCNFLAQKYWLKNIGTKDAKNVDEIDTRLHFSIKHNCH